MTRTCPDCRVAMIKRSFLSVELDTCQGCGGIFFDEGEISQVRARGGDGAFDQLEDMVEPEPTHTMIDQNQYRSCPGCSGAMHRYRYMYSSPVVLDSCEACGGVWVDNGELHQMRVYLQAAKDKGSQPLAPEVAEAAATLDAMSADQKARAQRARASAYMIANRW